MYFLCLSIHHFSARPDSLFNLFFKGREIAHKEIGFKLMERIRNELKGVAKVDKNISREGHRLTLILAPGNVQTAKPVATNT